MRPVLVALVMAIVAACSSTANPSPSPPPSVAAVASLTPTPTPSSTTAPPTPTPIGRHVNAVLGYTVTVSTPWRVSECLSRIELRDPTFVGQDVFTSRSAAEEQDLGVSGGTGATGAFAWVVMIEVQLSSQTATEYATARAGGNGGQVHSTTIDGKPAALLNDAAGMVQSYFVANAGRIYAITLVPSPEARPPAVTDAAFNGIARSITFTTPAPRPTPTPTPPVTPAVEMVADAVASAFAASDADRLRSLLTPKCWFNSGFNQSEGSATSSATFAGRLKSAFSQGLTVTVEPRPIMTGPPMPGTFWIWSTWSEYGTPPRTTPRSNVQLVFDQVDGRWYWVGALFNATR